MQKLAGFRPPNAAQGLELTSSAMKSHPQPWYTLQLNNMPRVLLDHACAVVFLNKVFGMQKVLEAECKKEL